MHTTPKIRAFMWSVCNNALATKSNLHNRHIISDPVCGMCNDQVPETMEHLFLSCPWTSSIWSHPLVRNSISFRGVHRIEKWLLDLLDNKEGLLVLETTASILWQIWKARNNSVFRQQRSNSEQVVQVALANVQSDRRCLPLLEHRWPAFAVTPPAF